MMHSIDSSESGITRGGGSSAAVPEDRPTVAAVGVGNQSIGTNGGDHSTALFDAAYIPFMATADLCDAHRKDCRVPQVDWRSFGGVSKFSGIAYTLDLRDCPDDNTLVKDTLENIPGHGQVLVVGAGGSRNCALLGDVLANAAVSNGWCGVVVHGCVRDSVKLSQMPLGVFAVATTPKKSDRQGRGKSEPEVEVGGTVCYRGDQVFCDSDGVVFLRSPTSRRSS